MGMEVRKVKTHSSDDRQKPCSRCNSSDDSLQLFRRVQNPKVYLEKAWTRMHKCMWAL